MNKTVNKFKVTKYGLLAIIVKHKSQQQINCTVLVHSFTWDKYLF